MTNKYFIGLVREEYKAQGKQIEGVCLVGTEANGDRMYQRLSKDDVSVLPGSKLIHRQLEEIALVAVQALGIRSESDIDFEHPPGGLTYEGLEGTAELSFTKLTAPERVRAKHSMYGHLQSLYQMCGWSRFRPVSD